MRIMKIESYGMDKLISGYKDFQNDEEYIKYGKKLSQFFENTEIIMHLSDVKGIELMILRKFCSSIVVSDIHGDTFEFVAPINADILRYKTPRSEDEKGPTDSLSILSSTMLKNYSVLKKKFSSDKHDISHWYATKCCDCGSYRFKIIARFEGVNITSLLSAFPETVFRIEGTREFVDPNSKDFNTLILKEFIKKFFNYMEETLRQVDTLTDVQFNRCYFNELENDSCLLSHIRTPYGFIDYTNINNSKELLKAMSMVMTDADQSGYTVDSLRDFTYHFMIRSTMESLIIFHALSNLVYYHEDLKILNGQESSLGTLPKTQDNELLVETVKTLDNYRLDIIKKLKEEETKKMKIHYNRVEIYEFIPRGAYISFAIHGTEREILQFISDIKLKGIYSKEMREIISSLASTIKLIQYAIQKVS